MDKKKRKLKNNKARLYKLPSPQELAEFRLKQSRGNKAAFSTTSVKNATVGVIPTVTTATLVLIGPLAGYVISLYTMLIFLSFHNLSTQFRDSISATRALYKAGLDLINDIGFKTIEATFTVDQLCAWAHIMLSIIKMIPDVKQNMLDTLNRTGISGFNREALQNAIESISHLEVRSRALFRELEIELDIPIQYSLLTPLPYEPVYGDYLNILQSANLI